MFVTLTRLWPLTAWEWGVWVSESVKKGTFFTTKILFQIILNEVLKCCEI